VMSMARLSAGAGYRYLLRHTAAGDAARPQSTPLVDYYVATGYPPGRWLGSGLSGLNDDAGIVAGSVVTEQALAALYAGRDPATGEPLGRPFPTYAAVDGRASRHAVAGFDLTFTVPKSVSVLWAMGNKQTRDLISQAHQQAVKDALRFVEQRVAATRTGHGGTHRVATRGVIAAAFDHWDTRAGDPNLHTHSVIANKVQGPDGQWRSLDGGCCTRPPSPSPSCTTTSLPIGSPPCFPLRGRIGIVAVTARPRLSWTAQTTRCSPSSRNAPETCRVARLSLS
jgi:TrwC relaxase